jgi:hypothetical protein
MSLYPSGNGDGYKRSVTCRKVGCDDAISLAKFAILFALQTNRSSRISAPLFSNPIVPQNVVELKHLTGISACIRRTGPVPKSGLKPWGLVDVFARLTPQNPRTQREMLLIITDNPWRIKYL